MFLIPVRAATAIVQVAPSVVMKMTDVSVRPNQMIANGSHAMLGIVCKAMTRKPSVSSRNRERANKNPSEVPTVIAMAKAISSRFND